MALVKRNGIQLNKVAVDPFEGKLFIPTFFLFFFSEIYLFSFVRETAMKTSAII